MDECSLREARGCPIGSAAVMCSLARGSQAQLARRRGRGRRRRQEKEAIGITGACLGQMNLLSMDLQHGNHQPTSNVQRSSGLGIEVHPEGGL